MLTSEELGPGAVCVHVEGELDAAHAYGFDDALCTAEADGLDTLVIDLRQVSFIDSAGLARIIAASRRARRNGHTLAVVRGCRPLERLRALGATDVQWDLVADPRDVVTADQARATVMRSGPPPLPSVTDVASTSPAM